MSNVVTPSQFRMRRLIRGWKREMEEKRRAEGVTRKSKKLAENCGVTFEGVTSDNIRISSIRPWQPSDDEPDGAA